jgi:hypothetical protein
MPDWSLRTIRNFPYSTAIVRDYELVNVTSRNMHSTVIMRISG